MVKPSLGSGRVWTTADHKRPYGFASEFTANALRDWCRFSHTGSAHIEPGSPWQNAYVESFGSRIRDELLAVEIFSCLAEAQVMVEDWRQDYNEHRPHSALGGQAPFRFAQGWSARQDALAASLPSPFGLTARDGDTPPRGADRPVADPVGVLQIESRAQMGSLRRQPTREPRRQCGSSRPRPLDML